MQRFFCAFLVLLSAFSFLLGFTETGFASEDNTSDLPMSEMKVAVTSQDHTATFQLYDTEAAKEFYDQLPLTLPLSNFRDAQWMFYPPKKLTVTQNEAYHDGKKGELSYYAPWGDVFMLYRDFYAGDEMHRLGVGLTGIDVIQAMSGTAVIHKIEDKGQKNMQLSISVGDKTLVYNLNDSQAAKDLFSQLPMTINVEDYGGNEMIFYPPMKLNTAGTPLAQNIKAGTLAYYAPWGDVVLFYEGFHSVAGLYELGQIAEGINEIRNLSGSIRIEGITITEE